MGLISEKKSLSLTFVHDNMIIPGPNGPLFTLQTKTFCKVAVYGEGLTKLQGRLWKPTGLCRDATSP